MLYMRSNRLACLSIEFLSTILNNAQQVSYMNVLQPMHIMINGEDAAGTKEAADFLRKLIKEQVYNVIHQRTCFDENPSHVLL